MGGLLSALAGGLSGLGQGMIEKAKADREAAVAALARSNAVEDRNAGFAHEDASQQAGFAHADTSQAASFKHEDTNLATTEAGANSRNAASIHAESARQVAGFAHEDGQISSTTKLNDGTVVGLTKHGVVPLTGTDGQPIKAAPKNTVTPEQANEIAIKQWNAYTGGVDGKEGTNDVINLDGSKANKGQWIASYRNRLVAGGGTLAPMASATPDAASTMSFSPTNNAMGVSGVTGGGLTSSIFGGQNTAPAAPPAAAPPQGAIDMLRKNPALKDAFDQKYGQGSSAQVLGQ